MTRWPDKFREAGESLKSISVSDEQLNNAIAVIDCVVQYLNARRDCGIVVSVLMGELETLVRCSRNRCMDVC